MKRYILESPFAAPTTEGIAANVAYACACVKDALLRGEAVIASHLLIAAHDILDDKNPEERALGIAAGLAWSNVSDGSVVYVDRGITGGMIKGIEAAFRNGKPVFFRKLDVADTTERTVVLFEGTRDEKRFSFVAPLSISTADVFRSRVMP